MRISRPQGLRVVKRLPYNHGSMGVLSEKIKDELSSHKQLIIVDKSNSIVMFFFHIF